MLTYTDRISRLLWIVSFHGLALFIPFSIAGSNICIGLGFIATLIALFTNADVRRRHAHIKNDPLFWGSLLLTVSALPSVLMSENTSRAWGDWKSYWQFLIYLLVAYNLVSAKMRRSVFWVLFASMCVSCLVALVQRAGGLDLFFFRIGASVDRPSSTMFTMTFAGVLYQVTTVSVAVLLMYTMRSRQALIMAAGVVLQITTQVLNLTRGAWLALAAGLFSLPGLLRRRRVFLIGIALVIVAGFVAMQSPKTRSRVSRALTYASNPTDEKIGTRLVLWDISIDIFKDHPLLGVGMGDYSEEADQRLAERKVTTTTDSHNVYLQILATRGLVGFIPFVFFWFTLFWMLIQSRRRAGPADPFAHHFISGALAVTIAVLVGALSENNIDDSEIFIAFMFIVGFARSLALSPRS